MIKIRKDKQYQFLSKCHENCNQYRQVWCDYLFKIELLSLYHIILISLVA